MKQTTIEDSLHNQMNSIEKKTPIDNTLEDSQEQEELDFIIWRIREVETNIMKRINELLSRITNTEPDNVKLNKKVQDATAFANRAS